MKTTRGVLEGPVIPLPGLSDAAAFRMCANGTDLFVSISGGPYLALGAGTGAPGAPVDSVQFNAAGAFGGSADFTYDGTNATFANVAFANGGVDTSGAGALLLGNANAITITVAAAGQTTTLGGQVEVAGTLVAQAGFFADGTVSPAQLRIAERIGDPGASANSGFVYCKDDTAVTQLFFQDSAGTVHQLTPQPAGAAAGAATEIQFNTGGVLDASAFLTFDGTALAFTGPDITLDPTNDFNLNMDLDGVVRIVLGAQTFGAPFGFQMLFPGGIDNALHVRTFVGSERIEIGPQSVGAHQVVVNLGNSTAGALTVQRGSDGSDFIDINTTTGDVTLGNSVDNGELVLLGTGDMRMQGGNALTFLDRGAPPASLGGRAKLYVQAVSGVSAVRVIDSAGTVTTLSGQPSFALLDNEPNAFLASQGADEYISIDTTNTAELVAIGQNAQNPSVELAAAAGRLGFYGTAGVAKPTVTGSRAANVALADLLTELAALGIITDSTVV